MRMGKHSNCGRIVSRENIAVEGHVVGAEALSGIRAHKLVAVLAGTIVLFMIGCTPDSTSALSGGTDSLLASSSSPVASSPISVTGGAEDPQGSQVALNQTSDVGGTDPAGYLGGNSLDGDPGADLPDNGPSASMPEPATCFLFLCAIGAMALARLGLRKACLTAPSSPGRHEE